jgi:hypothetical protein
MRSLVTKRLDVGRNCGGKISASPGIVLTGRPSIRGVIGMCTCE